ncbi:MAG: type III secretion system translocon subunit SctB [Victivallales bacterium]|nr:type III secretion system translocon subunit SctB [Victivallales bacterium]
MVDGIGNKPIQGGYGSTPSIDGGAHVGGTQETKETQGPGLHGQLKTEMVQKMQSTMGSSAPQLTPPAGKTDTTGVAGSILNTLGSLSIDDAGKGLFVLYQLLVLLQKALNEMQQSTQLIRQAETNVAMANIQSEADTMQDAATFGLWMGVISGIVQIGASAFSMVSGFKGVANTNKAKATGEQLKTAQAQMTELQAAEHPNADQIKAKQMEMTGLKTKMDMQLSTAQSYSNRGQAIGQFIGSFAQFFKAIGDGVAGGKQADAKRIEAQTKMMEEEASKTADLTKSVKDMLTAVLQLMNAVAKNETDTNAQILRGI